MSLADGQLRPRWRGRLHFVTFLVTLPAGAALLLVAESTTARVGVLVYVISLMLLFGTSAAYHLIAKSPRAQQIMRRLDHAMIFVQIAGTYTPVCLLALPRRWGIPILVTIWAAAILGIVLKVIAGPKLMRLSNALYPTLGWIAIAALPVILANLTTIEFALLAIGGVMYTFGALLFALRWPRLRPASFGYHEVWHIFTIIAATAHFGMVWMVAA